MNDKEAEQRHWEQLYRGLLKVKEFIYPAYEAAIAPIISGTVHFQNRPTVKILVIGGGEGNFSKRLLPTIRRMLKERGSTTRIEVVESDLTRAIKKAQGTRVLADMTRLPFKEGSFDLVVGESVIHNMHPDTIGNAIKEIKRVLKNGGSFVHVQDHFPDPTVWGDLSVRSHFQKGHPMVTKDQTNLAHFAPAALTAHKNLMEHLRRYARAEGMSQTTLEIRGSQSVSRKREVPIFGGIDLSGENAFHYNKGLLSSKKDTSIPKDERQLHYTGLVTITTKGKRVSDLVEHLQRG